MPSPGLPILPAELAVQIDSRFGRGWSLAAFGASRRTYAVRVGGRSMAVVKTLRPDRRPEDVCRALEIVRTHDVACPALLASVRAAAGWFALFEYVEGHGPDASSGTWAAMWSVAFSLLPRLAGICERVASWDLEREWLDNVASAASDDEAASDLFDQLRQRAPDGIPCLAHGDFAPQNFVLGGLGLTLIDWEDSGYARPGFDAGWLLSLNRVGAGPRWPQEVLQGTLTDLGIAASNLKWFEGMGLLRMHARAYSWSDRPFQRALVLETVRAAIREYQA
jgi:aminoglycoside phosphotransferase (APT) family kinase protein